MNAGVPVYFPGGVYRIATPLPVQAGMVVLGAPGAQTPSGKPEIWGVGTSVIRPSGYFAVSVSNLTLATASDGVHVIDADRAPLYSTVFRDCNLVHRGASGCLLTSVETGVLFSSFLGGTMAVESQGPRTDPAIRVSHAGANTNANSFRDLEWRANKNMNAPFCLLRSTASDNYICGWEFANIRARSCRAGVIHGWALSGLTAQSVECRDVDTYVDDIFKLRRGGASSLYSTSAVLVGCRRVGGAMADGAYVVNLAGAVNSSVIGPVTDRAPVASDLNLAGNFQVGS